jgi:hypothetical protein
MFEHIRSDSMSSQQVRPKRGLQAEPALRYWLSSQYADLIELSGKEEPPTSATASEVIREPDLLKRFKKKRDAIEAAFKELLTDGDVLGSGIADYADRREAIEPSLWDVLDVEYDYFDGASGENRKYENVEFFELAAIPLNIRTVPDWLDEMIGAAGYSSFRHEPDYRHIWLHGITYSLSALHAAVVKVLHQAALEGKPWQHGQQVLHQAGTTQVKMHDVFKSRKDWQAFIESDSKGMYRLRLDAPAVSTE